MSRIHIFFETSDAPASALARAASMLAAIPPGFQLTSINVEQERDRYSENYVGSAIPGAVVFGGQGRTNVAQAQQQETTTAEAQTTAGTPIAEAQQPASKRGRKPAAETPAASPTPPAAAEPATSPSPAPAASAPAEASSPAAAPAQAAEPETPAGNAGGAAQAAVQASTAPVTGAPSADEDVTITRVRAVLTPKAQGGGKRAEVNLLLNTWSKKYGTAGGLEKLIAAMDSTPEGKADKVNLLAEANAL